MSQVSPFRLLSTEDISSLQSALGAPVREWATEWLSSLGDSVYQLSEDFGGDCYEASDWVFVTDQSDAWLAWRLPEKEYWELFARLFGAPAPQGSRPTPMIRSLFDECLSDLVGRIFALAGERPSIMPGENVALDRSTIAYGSGAACLRPCLGLLTLTVAISGALAERIIARPVQMNQKGPAFVRRDAAIGNRVTRVEIVLGGAELTLADLANVSAGDVIRLQTRHREPLVVRATDGVPAFMAHLGSAENHKAIQVLEKAS